MILIKILHFYLLGIHNFDSSKYYIKNNRNDNAVPIWLIQNVNEEQQIRINFITVNNGKKMKGKTRKYEFKWVKSEDLEELAEKEDDYREMKNYLKTIKTAGSLALDYYRDLINSRF